MFLPNPHLRFVLNSALKLAQERERHCEIHTGINSNEALSHYGRVGVRVEATAQSRETTAEFYGERKWA